jgi:uncharacterized protein (TIGR02186 family)
VIPRAIGRILAAAFCVLALTGMRDPILVPDVSQREIQVRQDFTGTELLLFGAILDPGGTRAGRDYDIVVVVEGPTQPVVVREKRRVAGIWINADSTTFRSAPGYYAVAASKPLADLVDARTAAIYELGLDSLQLSPSGTIDPAAQQRFAAGLVDRLRRQSLYSEDDHGVTLTDEVLYRARIWLPSSVPTGTYTAETFALRKGRVVASALAHVEVRKLGLERAIATFARRDAFLYGILAVALSAVMGWIAGRVFALV